MSDWAPDQEAESVGCTVLIMGWLFTFAAGIAIGFWVLK